jgi:hypothetical protein
VNPRGIRVFLWVTLACVAAHGLHGMLGLGGDGLDPLFDDWIYNGVMVAAVAACLARAVPEPVAR